MKNNMNPILLVGRGTIGKALAAYDSDYHLISSQAYLSGEYVAGDWAGIVNCAAVVGAGKCSRYSWTHVAKANIALPLRIKERCKSSNIPHIQLSHNGLYQRQTSLDPDKFDNENSPVYPHNMYVASKILMEQMVADQRSAIFRIAFFDDDEQWYKRVINWTEVQNTYTSFTTLETLSKAIKNVIANAHHLNGVYNIATDVRYLPDFIDQLRERMSERLHPIPEMQLRTQHPPDMTAAVPICTRKAEEVGII